MWENIEKEKKNGYGSFTIINQITSDIYVGEFMNDVFHGYGTMTFHDGAKYIGEFKDNLFHGQGVYTLNDGTELEGNFQFGVFSNSQ